MEKFTIIQIFFCQINSLVIFQKMRFFDEIFAKMQKEKSVEFDDFTIFFFWSWNNVDFFTYHIWQR